MHDRMNLPTLTPTKLMVTGITGQASTIDNFSIFHLPFRFSFGVFLGGLAWKVAERYWEVRSRREDNERVDRIIAGRE